MNTDVNMSSYPKIQLIGCAKNEAAYLPEWIFYHLQLGFASIKVYVNNTDDNSVKVLDKIINQYPSVEYVVADDLIMSPPKDYEQKTNPHFFQTNSVQAISYTHALETRSDEFDFIMFLDIDEFFYPLKKMGDIFARSKSHNSLAQRFNWLLLSGDNEEFCSLAKCQKGYIDSSFKSAVPNLDSEIRAEDPHRFSINGEIGDLSEDGLVFHRVLRSKKEYLFLLARSTSDSQSKLANGFKKNRRGWTNKGKDVKQFDVKFDDSYDDNFRDFVAQCDIAVEIDFARDAILTKYDTIVEDIRQINLQNLELTRSLAGLDISHVSTWKTALLKSFWSMLRITWPRLILSHETLKSAIKAKLKHALDIFRTT